ncbi:diaminobutyrate acetyltransferase [Novosphingobium aerophilum]|uniref:diaminobutyrate acetyltransferase n=1 Tax=Novosphingobium aerophilum TaxID=2839843 RepID=UPI003FD65D27
MNEVGPQSDSASPIRARDEGGVAEGNSGAAIVLREPKAEDGPAISALIAASPPLDGNSAYCNLLQCSDFAGTCVVAERDGRLLGWISAYRPPSRPDCIFVWQVAVAAEARGEGLGGRMLDALIARSASRGARELTTTITEANSASWALFSAFARRHGAVLTRSTRFERDAHFAGAHDTEWQASISPLPFIPSN